MKKFVNCLTGSRILATLILPFMWKILSPLAIVIFVMLILLTDFFDGMLARKYNVQTLFGMILDQVADKAFGIMMLLIIGIYEPTFYLLVLMEVVIAVINILAALRGATTKSSFLGKTKMWVLGIATFVALVSIFEKQLLDIIKIDYLRDLLLTFMKNEESILLVVGSITVGSQIMVAVDYTRHILKELKKSNERIKYNFKSKKEIMKVLFDTKYYLKNKNLSYAKHFLK